MKKAIVLAILAGIITVMNVSAQELVHLKAKNIADKGWAKVVNTFSTYYVLPPQVNYRANSVFVQYNNVSTSTASSGTVNYFVTECMAQAKFSASPFAAQAKLHILINASGNQPIPFYMSAKFDTNPDFNLNDFNLGSNSTLIDDLEGHLGTGVVKNTSATPPSGHPSFHTEYVIPVTAWYQYAFQHDIPYLGFLFYLKPDGSNASTFINIWAHKSGSTFDAFSPWLELTIPEIAIPEPLSFILIGLGCISLGLYKKRKS